MDFDCILLDLIRIESNRTKKALELVPVPVIMIFVVLLFESDTFDLLDRYCHYLYSIHFYLHIYNDDCNI